MARQFLRQDWFRFSKFGKRRKNKLVWRRPRGTHSKIRIRKRGNPGIPLIGHKQSAKYSGKIAGLKPVLVHNMKELESVDKKSYAAILARVGARNKLEMIKKAESVGIKIINLSKGGNNGTQ